MTDKRKPHRLNVAGPFYVEDGCCTACGVPEAIAPELFAYDPATHCYVKRQPESVAELEGALRVIRTQELGCVRFRGTDVVVLRRLAEAGESVRRMVLNRFFGTSCHLCRLASRRRRGRTSKNLRPISVPDTRIPRFRLELARGIESRSSSPGLKTSSISCSFIQVNASSSSTTGRLECRSGFTTGSSQRLVSPGSGGTPRKIGAWVGAGRTGLGRFRQPVA
jgi:hypothetical protein